MKGDLTRKVLEVTGEGLVTTADIITAILESGYGASASKMNKNYRRLEVSRTKEILYREKMKSYHNLISKLNCDGFLAAKRKNWFLTAQGRKKLEKLRKRMVEHIPRKNYTAMKSKDLTVVSFDIPEQEKQKRESDWPALRYTLKHIAQGDFSISENKYHADGNPVIFYKGEETGYGGIE